MSLFLALISMLSAQDNPFSLSIQRLEIPGLPGLHSFAAAEFQGKWYLFGGRRDGLHRRQPFRAFDSAHANRYIWCVDSATGIVDSLPIHQLSPSLQSQFASTNMLFHQEGAFLYLAGGYGLPCPQDKGLFSPPSRFTDPEAHRTMPYLTRVDLQQIAAAFAHHTTSNTIPAQAFEQWSDTQFALTGGAMFYQAANRPNDANRSVFYLVGGHRFDGLYNPRGPQNGPGFEQEYHPGVRSFQLAMTIPTSRRKRKAQSRRKSAQANTLVVWNKSIVDSQFRRRDVNVLESLHHGESPLGSPGTISGYPPVRKDMLVFSGVFQERANIPYTNLLEINGEVGSITEVPHFHQLLNQYHSAHTSLYSYKTDAQFFLFFGGISQYFLNDTGALVQDPDVPVVTTLSVVQRNAANEYSEFALPIPLPKGIGPGTEFVLASTIPRMEGTEVIDLESLQGDSQLLGYLVGGFSTTAPNVFFDNDSNESRAESHIYAVYWKRNNEFRDPANKFNLADAWPIDQGNNGQIHFQAFTNTENGQVYFMINLKESGPCTMTIGDESNKSLLKHEFPGGLPAGESIFALPLYDANRTKTYHVQLESNGTVLKELLKINP